MQVIQHSEEKTLELLADLIKRRFSHISPIEVEVKFSKWIKVEWPYFTIYHNNEEVGYCKVHPITYQEMRHDSLPRLGSKHILVNKEILKKYDK